MNSMSDQQGSGEPAALSRVWKSSRALAWTVRLTLLILPVLSAWLVVRQVSVVFYRVAGTFGLLFWMIQALVVASSVSILVDRVTRRFVPLVGLLGMSLVFPDQAPSRFGVALRSGTIRQQQKRLDSVRQNGLDPQANKAAEQAIQLVSMLSDHDRLTRGHTERVRAYAAMIGEQMGLSETDRQMLSWGTMLHDIGKVMVPTEILNKAGRPDRQEWEILLSHPSEGSRLLEPLQDWLGDWVRAASDHHERWDGTGYPAGLSGTEISLAGRITAVADAYDVMTSRRSYKAPMPVEEARAELVRCSGSHFDPEVVRTFLQVSLRRRANIGPLAWLTEIPRLVASASATPASVVGGAILATSASAAMASPPPPDLAFVTPDTQVQVASTFIPLAQSTVTTSQNSEQISPTTTTTGAPTGSSNPTTVGTTLTTTTDPTITTTTDPVSLSSSSTTGSAPARTAPTTTAPTTTAPTTTAPTTTAPTTTAGSSLVLLDDAFTISGNRNHRLPILANDDDGGSGFDLGTLTIVVQPAHAQRVRVSGNDIRFKIERNYVGPDSLVYRVCNNAGECQTATVNITIES